MENDEKKKIFTRFLQTQAIFIGLLFLADQIFGFFEQNFFNTYLKFELDQEPLLIALMVIFSAIAGLIFNLVWGIQSDNTRSKWGRRRPYILIGGLIAGIAMILFSFSPNYFWAVILDAVIIGVASNAYFVSERALIPDTFEPELRGAANGKITIFGNLGILIGVALFLIADLMFSEPDPGGDGNILLHEGHIFITTIGGSIFIIAALIGFFCIKEKPASELPPKGKFFHDLKETFQVEELKGNKDFFKVIFGYVVFKTGPNTVMPFLFIFIFSLGLTTLQLLLVVAVSFPLLMLSTLTMGKLSDKYGRKKYISLFITIAAIGYVFMPFVKIAEGVQVNYILLFFTLSLVLIGLLGIPAPLDAWSQDLLPADKRGKFLGIYNLIWVVSQILGAFIGGTVAQLIGTNWIFIFGSLFMFLSIPIFLKCIETLNRE